MQVLNFLMALSPIIVVLVGILVFKQSAKKVAVWPQPEEAPGTTLSLYSDLYAAEAAERHRPMAASARAALLKSLKVTIVTPRD